MPDEYLSTTVARSVLRFSSNRTGTRISAGVLALSYTYVAVGQVMSRDLSVLTQVTSQCAREHPRREPRYFCGVTAHALLQLLVLRPLPYPAGDIFTW